MINKITKDSIHHIIFFLFLSIIIFFVWVKFPYNISSNYFLFNKKYINDDIVIVAIDEKTLNSNNFKRFQDITRWDFADLIRKISYREPAGVLVDVVFSQKSSNKSDDERLLSLFDFYENIIFATEFEEDKEKFIENVIIPNDKLWYINVTSYSNINILNDILSFQNIKNAIPFYTKQNFPIIFWLYSLINHKEVSFYNDTLLIWKDKKIPLNKNVFNINYFTQNYPQISFIDLIEDNVNIDLKDKIIFIWATAHDLHDEFLTPIDPYHFTPWVVILANAYNTITSGKHLYYPDFFIFLLINLVFLIIIFLFFDRFKKVSFSLLFSFWVLCWFLLFWVLVFILFWFFIEILPFIVWFIFLHIYIFLHKYIKELKNKTIIRNMFSRYLSKEVVDELVKKWTDDLQLWWKKQEVTIFFSDLAWFTDLSENLDPNDLWKIINIYFEEMSSIIMLKKWTIDKYIWDAIMAFWNAPLDVENHADMACETAIIQRKLLKNVRYEIQKLWIQANIDMRIGINTWNVVVGNFWSKTRFDFTILWDNVNLASRLEWIGKQYWVNIIISENTFNALNNKENFIYRELDLITVKWKLKPVKIYELIWFKDKDYTEELEEKLNNYSLGLEKYKQKDFKKAFLYFEKAWDYASKIFISRCEEYIKNPPPDDWDGVYRFKTK